MELKLNLLKTQSALCTNLSEQNLTDADAVENSLMSQNFCIPIINVFVCNMFVMCELKFEKMICYYPSSDTTFFFRRTIVFGSGLTILPSQNYARLLLMLYIMFCLILRTAYQGKQFEFMLEDMRPRNVETIEELLRRNYKILTLQDLAQDFIDMGLKKYVFSQKYFTFNFIFHEFYSALNITR